METKTCQNCKISFVIDQEDFNFYEKIKVPAPTWCPECRAVRRFSCANSWSLFWRNCDKCGIRTLSMFTPEQKLKVFCQPCWWADDWDGTEYAMDYDKKRPFFEQLKELALKTPYSTLESGYTTLKNCEYSNSIGYSKDCVLTIWADFCENVLYSSILNSMKNSLDSLRGWESELCYETIGSNKNYQTFFSDGCGNCIDVWFSRNCYSCTNCIGCVNLRGATNTIFNVKYSSEDYEKKLKEFKLESFDGLEKLKKKAFDFWLTKPYREYHGNTMNINVTGEYVYQSKNSKEAYLSNNVENSKFTQLITVASTKDCMDYTGWGNNVELLYECAQVGEGASNCRFSANCFPEGLNTEYCNWSVNSKNNFGCINLKRKNYSILNKQYSKEEYEKLRAFIVEDMKDNPYVDGNGRTWSYGEFFTPAFGNFAYNNSNAGKFFPKTKEQAIKEGYFWNDKENPTSPISLKSLNLPDTIKDTEDSILNEVVECSECLRGFKILKGELGLLRKMNLPVPHKCPKCRESIRFDRMNRPGMFHRQCGKCNKDIYTPYKPERPEIVYCVTCYQAEFA